MVPCKHLEALLPSLDRYGTGGASVQAQRWADIDRIADAPVEGQCGPKEEKRFRAKLRRLGVGEAGINLLFSKFVENYSVREIAKDQGYVNRNACSNYLEILLKDLRAKGFKKDEEE